MPTNFIGAIWTLYLLYTCRLLLALEGAVSHCAWITAKETRSYHRYPVCDLGTHSPINAHMHSSSSSNQETTDTAGQKGHYPG